MKALVLAAGYGTRLYPLTKNLAKPLVTVADKTILQHIIEKLEKIATIDEIFVTTNHTFFDQVERYLGRMKSSKKITVFNDGTTTNENRLGAVGDIHFTIERANINDDLLVIAGDNLFGFSLQEFISFFQEKGQSAIALRDLEHPDAVRKRFGVCILEGSQVIDFQEKPEEPKSTLAATACYLYHKDDLPLIRNAKREELGDAPGNLFKHVVENSGGHGFSFKEHWFDIGSHENLSIARKHYYDLHLNEKESKEITK